MKQPNDKKFSELLPWPRRVISTTKKLARGLAVTGLGTLALGSGLERAGATPFPQQPPVRIVNRDRKASAGQLVLALADGSSVMPAYHRSHRSHSSHRSHYSSSTRPKRTPSTTTTTRPSTTTTTPSSAATTQSRIGSGLIDAPKLIQVPAKLGIEISDIQRLVVHITEIELETKSFSGKDEFDTPFTFYFSKNSEFHKMSPIAVTQTFKKLLKNPDKFPMKEGDEVLVDWAPDREKRQRAVVRVTKY